MKNQYRVNEQIRVREVRVVSEGGAEVMPTRKALDLARQQELDLVEISPNAQPPVCRIVDYSKFLYQQKMDREKREAEAKAAADAERAANAEKNGLLANAKGGDALKKLAEGTED